MKRFIVLGAVCLLSLTSCSNPLRPKAEGGTEIVNEHPDVPMNSNPFEPTTDPPAVSVYTDSSPIICKIRHYRTDSFTKSDLIIQADGKVWCGFYMQNEGQIGTDNILRKSDGTEMADLTLMDDLWLDAYVTETAEDDFMLFGEIIDLGQLDEKTLAEYSKLASKVSAYKPYAGKAAAEDSVKDYYYADIIAGSDNVRVSVLAELGKSRLESSDASAMKLCSLIMNVSNDYYAQWEQLCAEKLSENQ